MSDSVLVRVGRWLAAYATVASVVGGALYVSLGHVDQLFQDWVLHNIVGGGAIGVLVWFIVPREPRNAAVWALILSAVFQSTNALALGIGQRQLAALGLPSDLALVVPADLPLATALVLQVGTWVWVPGMFLMMTLALLLFPDGRPPGPRWRWVAWSAAGGMTAISVVLMWSARPSREVAVYGDAPLAALPTALEAVFVVGGVALAVGVVASVVGLGHRYRSSTGLVRQQFRWIAWGATVFTGAVLIGFALAAVPSFGLDALRVGAAALMPVYLAAYVVAVGRYRLYEIDRIISRTASYAIITVTLAATYVALVLSLQIALAPFTGGSELAVAASTLLVAAAFVPVRRRVQTLVDRRFNRPVHDARRAIADFAQGLRDEVELDAVRGRLAGVAATAVQPEHARVWLAERPGETAGADGST